MIRLLAIFFIVMVTTLPANARQHRHHHRGYQHSPQIRLINVYPSEGFLPHPPGCPSHAFCGCGASVEVFGRAVRSLWPASAWFRFPRTAPSPGMVGVRSHHVFVLRQHIEGQIWLIADYNSGGHQSRLHQRSISGYAIVNPHGSHVAGL